MGKSGADRLSETLGPPLASPADNGESKTALFFTVKVLGKGRYDVSSNMGDYWKWEVLKLAGDIRKELGV